MIINEGNICSVLTNSTCGLLSMFQIIVVFTGLNSVYACFWEAICDMLSFLMLDMPFLHSFLESLQAAKQFL